jgi:hypothetical protein
MAAPVVRFDVIGKDLERLSSYSPIGLVRG